MDNKKSLTLKPKVPVSRRKREPVPDSASAEPKKRQPRAPRERRPRDNVPQQTVVSGGLFSQGVTLESTRSRSGGGGSTKVSIAMPALDSLKKMSPLGQQHMDDSDSGENHASAAGVHLPPNKLLTRTEDSGAEQTFVIDLLRSETEKVQLGPLLFQFPPQAFQPIDLAEGLLGEWLVHQSGRMVFKCVDGREFEVQSGVPAAFYQEFLALDRAESALYELGELKNKFVMVEINNDPADDDTVMAQ